nr:EOG090X01SN [Moina brachiata]
MSFLRGSANYVWCTTSVLGKGATGAVFQGVNKHTGEAVAVKTFNQLSHMRPQEVQMREFEVLKKVNHENIVKLLAIEEEQDGKGKVIVMELCTGGSLFNILDDPENSTGLPEDEFLAVLEHLTAGMKHLRDNSLVHRDLKPGNIMKFVAIDGKTIYKLTDFGAARELEDGQQFVSLYGTEEYLHPDMYERAVLRKPVGKTFGATVDLWSIGVTLYHVATGNLPFRPYGGRRNKETMYYITAKKMSGVISGVQNSENGEILWSRELPDTCLLSTGLKKIVTPLFAGLMEVDQHRMWNFDRFFQEVTAILNRKPVHVFHVNSGQYLRLYVLPLDCSDAHNSIEEQSGVARDDQLILHKGKMLLNIDHFPISDVDHPLFLFNKKNNNVSISNVNNIAKPPTFPPGITVENDASTAKQFCCIGFSVKRRVEELYRCCKHMFESVNVLSTWLLGELGNLSQQALQCEDILTVHSRQLYLWETLHKPIEELFGIVCNEEDARIQPFSSLLQLARSNHEEVANEAISLSQSVQQLHQRVVLDESLSKEWTAVANFNLNLEGVVGKALTYVTRMKESWQHLLRDRAARVLTYNDEQFHLLERIKVSETFKHIEALLSSDCVPAILHAADALADWYKMAQAVVLQTDILVKDVSSMLLSLHDSMKNFERIFQSYSIKIEDFLQEATPETTTLNNATCDTLDSSNHTKGFVCSAHRKGLSETYMRPSSNNCDLLLLLEENSKCLSTLEQNVKDNEQKHVLNSYFGGVKKKTFGGCRTVKQSENAEAKAALIIDDNL